MRKTIEMEFQELSEFFDYERLGEFVRNMPAIRWLTEQMSKATDGNYTDGIASVRMGSCGRILVDFEVNADVPRRQRAQAGRVRA